MTRDDIISALLPEVKNMSEHERKELSEMYRLRTGEGWLPSTWDIARELAIRRGMVIG
jgi:hypothetical protein